jgi:hypothetical protein
MEGSPLGRNHDGGGHEALHHIPGDDYRRPAARVTGRKVAGRGAELLPDGDSRKCRNGGAEAFVRADAARVRNELVRCDLLLGCRLARFITLPLSCDPSRAPHSFGPETG